jgi:hypothetical protein
MIIPPYGRESSTLMIYVIAVWGRLDQESFVPFMQMFQVHIVFILLPMIASILYSNLLKGISLLPYASAILY